MEHGAWSICLLVVQLSCQQNVVLLLTCWHAGPHRNHQKKKSPTKKSLVHPTESSPLVVLAARDRERERLKEKVGFKVKLPDTDVENNDKTKEETKEKENLVVAPRRRGSTMSATIPVSPTEPRRRGSTMSTSVTASSSAADLATMRQHVQSSLQTTKADVGVSGTGMGTGRRPSSSSQSYLDQGMNHRRKSHC